jgi:hypothetical protein
VTLPVVILAKVTAVGAVPLPGLALKSTTGGPYGIVTLTSFECVLSRFAAS